MRAGTVMNTKKAWTAGIAFGEEEQMVYNPTQRQESDSAARMTITLDPNKPEQVLMVKMQGAVAEVQLTKAWPGIVKTVVKEYKRSCEMIF